MSHNPQKNDHLISTEIIAFIIDRQARQLSPRTIQYYQDELGHLQTFLASQSITTISQLTPETIRLYLIHLADRRNKGGQHAAFRAIKAFCNWYSDEIQDPTWRNPIRNIQPPKITTQPLPGIPTHHIQSLLATCDKNTFTGQRDKAIILTLLDTGARKNEFCSILLNDLDLKTGAIHIRTGKGDKPRTVFVGVTARREIIRYLRTRPNLPENAPLWATSTGTQLTPAGLRQIIRRRSLTANIPEPQIHDFRRTFAIESLRNGIDLITLMRLMGHTSTAVLQRYLNLLQTDLQTAHARTSPADHLK